jgi:hypothetical protein
MELKGCLAPNYFYKFKDISYPKIQAIGSKRISNMIKNDYRVEETNLSYK